MQFFLINGILNGHIMKAKYIPVIMIFDLIE